MVEQTPQYRGTATGVGNPVPTASWPSTDAGGGHRTRTTGNPRNTSGQTFTSKPGRAAGHLAHPSCARTGQQRSDHRDGERDPPSAERQYTCAGSGVDGTGRPHRGGPGATTTLHLADMAPSRGGVASSASGRDPRAERRSVRFGPR